MDEGPLTGRRWVVLLVHVASVYRHRMESFPEASGRLLLEFKLQLSHRPLLVSAERLLQITAVNMFSVDNTVPKGSVCSRAFQFGKKYFDLLHVSEWFFFILRDTPWS